MQKWSLNNHRIEVVQAHSEKDLLESIQEPVRDRNSFVHDGQRVTIPRYFLRIIGVEDQEKDYHNYLFDLDKSLQRQGELYLRVTEGFDESFDKELLREMNLAWSALLLLPEVTGKIITDHFYNTGLLVDFPNEYTAKQLRGNLQGLLEYYFEVNRYDIDPNELKAVVFYLVSWSHLYVKRLFTNFDYQHINPKILYYGDISKEEILFLIYLSSMGCDVLYFHPQREVHFEEVDRGFSAKVEFPRKMALQPFPKKRTVERATTVAYGASEQINDLLGGEESLYYRPWALIDAPTQAVTLKTTYPEVAPLAKEPAMVRPEWQVADGVVHIPNIFAKVSGTHRSKNQYWKEVYDLMEARNTLNFKTLPISAKPERDYYQEYFQLIDTKGHLLEEKLLSWTRWPYQHLPTGLQKRLAHEICEICNRTEVTHLSIQQKEPLKVKLLGKLLEVEEKFIKLVQTFDFPQEVPKIVIYNNETNGDLSFEDAIVLRLLNRLGLDVVIFNPTGHNDIENHLNTTFYDVHRLEQMEFNMAFKEKSFLSRFF